MTKNKLTLQEYCKLKQSFKAITTEIEKMSGKNNSIPACIVSYHYSPNRSLMINELLENPPQDGRTYYIFCYEEERELYEEMNKDNIFNLIFIKEVGTLPEKRQYVLDWSKKHDYKNIFMFEDDSCNLSLPLRRDTSIFNDHVYMKFEEVLKYWEHLTLKFKFDFSSGLYEDILHKTTINKRYKIGKGFVPMIQWNVDKFFLNNLHYKNGFYLDDHEMFFQALKKKMIPAIVLFGQRANEMNSNLDKISTFDTSWRKRFVVGTKQLEKLYPGKVSLIIKNGKPNIRAAKTKDLIELAKKGEW